MIEHKRGARPGDGCRHGRHEERMDGVREDGERRKGGNEEGKNEGRNAGMKECEGMRE